MIRALEHHSPDEIYHLSGPSSVSHSFAKPAKYLPRILNQATVFLEALKKSQSNARFVNSASTDCFGNQPTVVLDEESSFAPISPYGIAKASTFWITKNYREAFGVNACSAILTNHESPLRGEEFVTHKIVKGVREIAEGKSSSLTLGNTKVGRDWLWADDVAHALELIGSSELAEEFVVASGKTSTLMDFVSLACAEAGLAVDEVVSIDPQLFRPADIEHIRLNPQKIMDTLGWKPRFSVEEIVHHLVHDTLA
jgi:GDPmannose 4,6-dehydratase